MMPLKDNNGHLPVHRKNAHTLTPREKEILKLLTDGYSNDETAQFLLLSRRTVEAHRARIMLKLAIHDLPGLVKYAIREGISSIDEHRSRD